MKITIEDTNDLTPTDVVLLRKLVAQWGVDQPPETGSHMRPRFSGRIAAIKEVRIVSNLSLAVAKEVVDALFFTPDEVSPH